MCLLYTTLKCHMHVSQFCDPNCFLKNRAFVALNHNQHCPSHCSSPCSDAQHRLHTYAQLLLVIVTISTPLARRTVNENFFVFVCICDYALRARSGLSVCAKPDSNVKHLPIEGLLLRATGNRGARAPVGRVKL
jgi:hypothetical protein